MYLLTNLVKLTNTCVEYEINKILKQQLQQ